MKIKLLLIAIFLCRFYTYGQNINDLTKKNIASYVFEFTLEDKTSKGYQFLEKLVSQNDFFLLGEYHFSNNIQLLTSEICELGNKYGYTYFICENGRYSMKFLNAVVNGNMDIKNALKKYLKPIKTTIRLNGEIEVNNPIAFFSTYEEIALLDCLKKFNYQLYGIDQEYYFSTKLFIKELAKLTSEKCNKVNLLYERLDSLSNNISNSDFNYCEEILKDTLLVNFLKSYNKLGMHPVYKSWQESMQIYYGRGRHSRRISMMRTNFIEQISPGFNFKKDLKAIVKLGALHTSKGLTDYGVYDVGDLVNTLAKKNGKKSIHIRCAKRFYIEQGNIVDYCEEEQGSGDNLLRKFGKKDKWVIIDLREIRKEYQKGEFNIPESLVNNEFRYILDHNDIFIITPTDKNIVEL